MMKTEYAIYILNPAEYQSPMSRHCRDSYVLQTDLDNRNSVLEDI